MLCWIIKDSNICGATILYSTHVLMYLLGGQHIFNTSYMREMRVKSQDTGLEEVSKTEGGKSPLQNASHCRPMAEGRVGGE